MEQPKKARRFDFAQTAPVGAPMGSGDPMEAADSMKTLLAHFSGANAPASAPAASTPASMPQAEAAETPDYAQAAPAPAAPPPDVLMEQYTKRVADLERERQRANETADSERQYSDQEKIALALISALPGLVGAGLGGAIAGGQGAAIGAAGGLQGSAQAVNTIHAGKEGRRKEAKEEAGKLRELGDAVQQAADHRAAQLEQQARAEANRKEDIGLKIVDREREMDWRSKENALDRAARERQAKADREAAAAERANAAPKQKVGDVSFVANVDAGLRYLDELEGVVQKFGNFESAAGDQEAKAKLEAIPYQLAIAYAKIVDPESVAREGEVDAAKKYVVPMGLMVRNGQTMAAIENMRKDLLERAKDRVAIKEGAGVDIPLSAPASSDPFAKGRPRQGAK